MNHRYEAVSSIHNLPALGIIIKIKMKFALVAAIAGLLAGEAYAQDPRCSPFPRRSGMQK